MWPFVFLSCDAPYFHLWQAWSSRLKEDGGFHVAIGGSRWPNSVAQTDTKPPEIKDAPLAQAGGIGFSKNQAVAQCQFGKHSKNSSKSQDHYLCFLDADDIMNEHRVLLQVTQMMWGGTRITKTYLPNRSRLVSLIRQLLLGQDGKEYLQVCC
jgi:hypothetical protein